MIKVLRILINSSYTRCPDDSWTKYNDHCYKLFNRRTHSKTWSGARDFCHSKGGDLAVVSEAEENGIVYGWDLQLKAADLASFVTIFILFEVNYLNSMDQHVSNN